MSLGASGRQEGAAEADKTQDLWGSDTASDDDAAADDDEGVTASEALVTIHPGFAQRGHRMSHKHGEVECSMSYSALGGREESWKVTISETPWQWQCHIKA